ITETLHTGGSDLPERMRDDAWAVTHSACYRMTLRIGTFRGRNAFGRKVQFATWAYAIAQNELRTLLRNRWRERKRYGGSRDEWESPVSDDRGAARAAAPLKSSGELPAIPGPTGTHAGSPEHAAMGRFES